MGRRCGCERAMGALREEQLPGHANVHYPAVENFVSRGAEWGAADVSDRRGDLDGLGDGTGETRLKHFC